MPGKVSMSVPENTVVYSTPHIALTWFIKQTITIVGFKKGAQKSTQRKRRKGARRSKAAGVCAVLPSCPIRPFTAPSAPFCFWSFVTELSLFWLHKESSHVQKSRKFDKLFGKKVCSYKSLQSTWISRNNIL